MDQTMDYKTLPLRIGLLFTFILMIVGWIFMLVAIIEMKEYGTFESSYLDGYDYDLLMMKTYGSAMAIGGCSAWLINLFMILFVNRAMRRKKTTATNEKNTEVSSVCAICGAKSTSLKTVTVGDNEKIRLCPQCCSEENEK